MSTKEFNSGPGWALSHYTMTYEPINDADVYMPDSIRCYVAAYKAEGSDKPARIDVDLSAGGFELKCRLSPARARKLAAALIEAADVCEQFEAQQEEVQS